MNSPTRPGRWFRASRKARRGTTGRRGPQPAPVLEALEERTLLASTLTITAADALQFVGTALDNNLTISYSGGTYTISDTADTITIVNNGTATTTGDGTNSVTVTGVNDLSFDTAGGNGRGELAVERRPDVDHRHGRGLRFGPYRRLERRAGHQWRGERLERGEPDRLDGGRLQQHDRHDRLDLQQRGRRAGYGEHQLHGVGPVLAGGGRRQRRE